jgi:hypothetical protein
MVFDLTIGHSGDIAPSRQLIRSIVQEYGWSNVFGIRAIAALTAMAEVLYFGQKAQMDNGLRLSLNVINEENGRGVEFYAQTDFEEVCRNHAASQWKLERVSNELEIFHDADGDAVVDGELT